MTTHISQLRAWAENTGDRAVTAATELLLRAYDGQFARPENPWIREVDDSGLPGIDFEQLADHVTRDSESAFLQIAASLSGMGPGIDLSKVLNDLDDPVLPLVLSAMVQSADRGFSQVTVYADGTISYRGQPAWGLLYVGESAAAVGDPVRAPEDSIRAAAAIRGMAGEAAAELLLRAYDGKFARPGNPWVEELPDGGLTINFGRIPDHLATMPEPEANFLILAASLADCEIHIDLGVAVEGLDERVLPFVFAAIAHANGAPAMVEYTVDADGTEFRKPLAAVYPWPG